jgi:co-chaperonin GroES (HSP10)
MNTEDWYAINNFVIIRPIEEEDTGLTESGLIVVENKPKRIRKGTIVSSPAYYYRGSESVESPVEEGCVVFYAPSLGVEIEDKFILYPIESLYALEIKEKEWDDE